MKIGIYGYGNLGKGVELAVDKNSDIELQAIFTRRNPKDIVTTSNVPVISTDKVLEWKDKIDVMVICGGSATDLPIMTPMLSEHFNVVDSYDNHSNIYNHYMNVNTIAKSSNKVALISCGWDPGMFSLNRLYANSILPDGKNYTFWGRGVSQGHSNAIRRISGVIDAKQYTIPIEEALNKVREGLSPELNTREKHRRDCYVVIEDGADKERICDEIVNMPDYFADYDTTVNFISNEELKEKHSALPHGGSVIRTGYTSDNNKHRIEYTLNLDSNPEFTGIVLASFARAVKKMYDRGTFGCKTVFDIAPIDLFAGNEEELIKKLL